MSVNNYIELIEYGRQSVDDYIAIVEKELAKQYAGAYRYASAKLAELYAKYDMTLPEVKKYNRYDTMLKDIDREFKKVTGKAQSLTEKTSTASVTTGYNANWFAMEQVEGSLQFGKLPLDAIKASVYSEYSGANFITRYGILYQSTVDKVAQAITRGIVRGEGYAVTAKQVKDIFGLSYADTMRIIRTESSRAWTEGSLESYKRADELKIKAVKTWIATRDGRTRENHARLNGKQADKPGADGLFHMDGMTAEGPSLWGVASEDINCRCDTYYALEGIDDIKHWTYAEWQKDFEKWKP